VADVARAVRYMAGLPLDANVATMTVMATKMPVHRPRLSWPVTTSSDLLDAGDCSGAGGSGMVRT
jgi:hypothetical protein